MVSEPELIFCYLLDAGTCAEEQLAAASNGSARVVRYIVEDANGTALFPQLSGLLSINGSGSESGGGSGEPGEAARSAATSIRMGLGVSLHICPLMLPLQRSFLAFMARS